MEKLRKREVPDISAVAEERLGLLSEVLPQVMEQFRKLDAEGRAKLLRTLSTLFSPDDGPQLGPITSTYPEQTDRFSKEQSLTPKEFILKKQPNTDVDRIACLAYYLAHYRSQQHFKTLDLSKVNTEAAQTKLSNPTRTVENAVRRGFLVPAVKGSKQLSAVGEKFVEALPDKEAAARTIIRPKRKKTFRRKRIFVDAIRPINFQEA